MKCPVDNAVLQMSERSGIEIDYCQECRGVWLDRGELDKIIERAEVSQPSVAPVAQAQQQPRQYEKPYEDGRRDSYRDDKYRGGHYGKKKKKESFLGELFDF